jgi:hypothetical protein
MSPTHVDLVTTNALGCSGQDGVNALLPMSTWTFIVGTFNGTTHAVYTNH